MARRIGKVYQRRKSRYRSARAAWHDIARETGLSPSTHVIRPEHSARLWRWRVLGRRRRRR